MTYSHSNYEEMLKNFASRRQEIVDQKSVLEKELEGVDQIILGIQKLISGQKGEPSLVPPQKNSAPSPPAVPPNYAILSVAEAARIYLGGEKTARSTQDIKAALKAGGLDKNYGTVYSGLLRSKYFKQTKGKKWRLAEAGEDESPRESQRGKAMETPSLFR